MKIALIACSPHHFSLIGRKKCKARYLYSGLLFQARLKWGEKKCNRVFILSGKYGAISPDTFIENYDLCIKSKTNEELVEWGNNVLKKLDFVSLEDEVYFLCQKSYFTPFANKLKGKHHFISLQFAGKYPSLERRYLLTDLGLLPPRQKGVLL